MPRLEVGLTDFVLRDEVRLLAYFDEVKNSSVPAVCFDITRRPA